MIYGMELYRYGIYGVMDAGNYIGIEYMEVMDAGILCKDMI